MSSRLLIIAVCITLSISMLDANSSVWAGCGDYVIFKGNHASFAHEMIERGFESEQGESDLIRWHANQFKPSEPSEPCHGPGCESNRQSLANPFTIPTTQESPTFPNAVVHPACFVPKSPSSRFSTLTSEESSNVFYSIDRPPE